MKTMRIGVSTCLLGQKVRYDGGHKRDPYILDVLGRFFEFVGVCPESEAGFPIPREPFRLIGEIHHPRLITQKTLIDHTDRMIAWSHARCDTLAAEDLCGYIFKSKSPSSGLFRVKVYNEKGVPVQQGTGIFARIFTERFPLIPVEEEGRINDLVIRENFLERVFVYHRWLSLGHTPSASDLVMFHTTHKLLLMSHSIEHYRRCGNLVASIRQRSLQDLMQDYIQEVMRAMVLKATVKKHINVMMHVMGFFKKHLNADQKAELLELFDLYRHENVPLIVPITMLNHYVRRFDIGYLKNQLYLNPHPIELKLRNHA